MNKLTKALQFDQASQMQISIRDKKCFFCKLGYHIEHADRFALSIPDIMHVVNKSQLGLGVEQNGVLGCRYHHHLLDNGNKGLREEMESMLKDYMRSLYPGWTEESVTYSKWNGLKFSK